MKGKTQWDFSSRLPRARARNGCGVNLCAYTAFLTKVVEVGGEAVTQVDHGRRQVVFSQILTNLYAGLRREMARTVDGSDFPARTERFKSRSRFSQHAADVNS